MKVKATKFLIYIIAGYISYLMISVFFLPNNAPSPPKLIWWNDFKTHPEAITCPSKHKCVVAAKTSLTTTPDAHVKALLFYGSFLDLKSLPQDAHYTHLYWALFHEESPKNLPALRSRKLQRLFNITATFSRHSTFPITLQYLRNTEALTSLDYYVDVRTKNRLQTENNQAPILYIQSDCDTPIGRDKYVKELMDYVRIDSFGACLNNKPLPKELELNGTYELFAEELLRFSAKYKFIIAIENARCEDYITEKLWRPLITGAIPIYFGAPSIKDWLPNAESAILFDDFASTKDLAEHIARIDSDDVLYNTHMAHKLKQTLSNQRLMRALSAGNFGVAGDYDDVIPAFECFVCDAVHAGRKFPPNTRNIFDCAEPVDDTWRFAWQVGGT